MEGWEEERDMKSYWKGVRRERRGKDDKKGRSRRERE